MTSEIVLCRMCEGYGDVETHQCPECKGSGKLEKLTEYKPFLVEHKDWSKKEIIEPNVVNES